MSAHNFTKEGTILKLFLKNHDNSEIESSSRHLSGEVYVLSHAKVLHWIHILNGTAVKFEKP